MVRSAEVFVLRLSLGGDAAVVTADVYRSSQLPLICNCVRSVSALVWRVILYTVPSSVADREQKYIDHKHDQGLHCLHVVESPHSLDAD